MPRKDWDFGFEKIFGSGFDPWSSRFDWPRAAATAAVEGSSSSPVR